MQKSNSQWNFALKICLYTKYYFLQSSVSKIWFVKIYCLLWSGLNMYNVLKKKKKITSVTVLLLMVKFESEDVLNLYLSFGDEQFVEDCSWKSTAISEYKFETTTTFSDKLCTCTFKKMYNNKKGNGLGSSHGVRCTIFSAWKILITAIKL